MAKYGYVCLYMAIKCDILLYMTMYNMATYGYIPSKISILGVWTCILLSSERYVITAL